jgi:hypothetical protein
MKINRFLPALARSPWTLGEKAPVLVLSIEVMVPASFEAISTPSTKAAP